MQADTINQQVYLQSIKKFIVLSNPKRELDSAKVVYTLDSFVDAKTDTFFVKYIGFESLSME